MITHYLKSAIKNIEDLIQFTTNDIEDIKEGKGESIFSRTKLKDELVNSFENKKALIDGELRKLLSASPDSSLEKVLPENDQDLLESMRVGLTKLQGLNTKYAKLVSVVSEFYNSLMDRLFPGELDGYNKTNMQPASLLKIVA